MDVAITIVMLVPVILAVALIVGIIRRNVTERRSGDPVDIRGAIPAIIVLLVAVLVIGSMAEVAEDRYEVYDCVPLSSFGSGATVSGDCAEIVTIGDEQYIRMTDVGTFTVTSGGSSKEYTVEKAKMDLFVWAGQSNSVRFTNPSYYDGDATISPGKGFYIGSESGEGEDAGILTESTVDTAAIWDMIADDGSMRVAQMYPSFYGDYYSETGHRIMTVSTGISGQSISIWDDDGRGDVYMKAALEKLEELCEGKIELTPKAVLWIQGEADATATEEFYLEHFEPLLEKFEDGYYGYSFPYTTSSLPRTAMRPITNMNDAALAQIQEAEDNPYFTIATYVSYRATSDQYRDSVHFTQEYYGWVGEAFARQMAKLTGYRPVSETIVLVEPVGSVLTLPSTVTAYGTSGEAYTLRAAWTETGTSGVYDASLSRAPFGTAIADGLTASATLLPPYSYDTSTGTLTVNDDVESLSVQPWDSYASSVKVLTISEGVDSVGAGAFDSLTSLTGLTIPSTLETIGDDVFSLTLKDYMGQTVTASSGEYVGKGDGTLYRADASIYTYKADGRTITGLTSDAASAVNIVFPTYSSVNGKTILHTSSQLFRANTNIAFAGSAPGCVIDELPATFRECTSLTAAVFLGSHESMAQTLMGCTSLAYAVLPETLTTLGQSTFNGCTSLTSIAIPDSVTTIGKTAFSGCTLIDGIVISDSVTTIGDAAFNGCTSLTSIAIPASVTSIGAQAFKSCAGITSVTFGSGFSATLGEDWAYSWTFYDTDGTTELDKTVASNLAGHTFVGTYSALVMQS